MEILQYNMPSCGTKVLKQRVRRYPTMDDSDSSIESFVESQRMEYYHAWYHYVKDFEEVYFF